MKPIMFCLIALFTLHSALSYSQSGPSAQNFSIGDIRINMAGYANKQPAMTSNTTYAEVLLNPSVTSHNVNCKVAQFTISIQPVGLPLSGPYIETGDALSSKEISLIKSLQSSGTKATITVESIQTTCGTTSYPVVGRLIYQCN